MNDQVRLAAHRIQRAHWKLMLDRRGHWSRRKLLEHHRSYVEGAYERVQASDPVFNWFRRWT